MRPMTISRLAGRALALAGILAMASCSEPAGTLDIYFIDVEGGQATLVMTPAGETLLIDAGNPGDGGYNSVPGDPLSARDAQRILAAANDAGVMDIDYLLVTHFHADHVGGAAELSQLMPIGAFIDHGADAVEAQGDPRALAVIAAYKNARALRDHITPQAGGRLPLKGAKATIVSTGGDILASPLKGAGETNHACNRPVLPPGEAVENPRSTGVVIEFGRFRFLDLGDLTGQPLSDLVCPVDMIGPVDAYLVTHHGGADAADAATFAAFRPRVAILNNGRTKGGDAPLFAALRASGSVGDVWQLHRSDAAGDQNYPEDRIANLDESGAHWIKLSAFGDGSFRIYNGRTGVWKDYDPD